MYTHTKLIVSVILMSIVYCSATTTVVELSGDNKRNDSMMTGYMGNSIKPSEQKEGKHLNYLRLLDGQCHNCSTYKCTSHKANMGGSEWCIMLFSDALAHCDSDPNCGGYTMTTADWFHKQYDKNGQVAVHLTKLGEKPFNCSLSEWSSYEKQNTVRDTPVVYGRSTCPDSNQDKDHKSKNYNYVFESNSKVASEGDAYLCPSHSQNLDDKDFNCILTISDGITHCNSDPECQGFAINTDEDWQKKYSKNGMQAVQLFGTGATYTLNQMWRSFKKQF